MSKDNEWAKTIASVFIRELPTEYIRYIIDTKEYVINIVGSRISIKAKENAYSKSLKIAENKSIEILNAYYTNLIREELIKQINIKP